MSGRTVLILLAMALVSFGLVFAFGTMAADRGIVETPYGPMWCEFGKGCAWIDDREEVTP